MKMIDFDESLSQEELVRFQKALELYIDELEMRSATIELEGVEFTDDKVTLVDNSGRHWDYIDADEMLVAPR